MFEKHINRNNLYHIGFEQVQTKGLDMFEKHMNCNNLYQVGKYFKLYKYQDFLSLFISFLQNISSILVLIAKNITTLSSTCLIKISLFSYQSIQNLNKQETSQRHQQQTLIRNECHKIVFNFLLQPPQEFLGWVAFGQKPG